MAITNDKDTAFREPFADRIIGIVDTALNTLWGKPPDVNMTEVETGELSSDELKTSVSLMRVNHTGEICAQALYEGQALVARSPSVRDNLRQAAVEERTHLAWCRTRLNELEGDTSLLDPFFYMASAAIGVATGLMGDRISLGFVEATEDQVQAHLDRHIESLPVNDDRSRAILEDIRRDEARHGEAALDQGGLSYPVAIRMIMTLASKVMTESTKRI